jgi:hypothetical protein
MTINTLAIKGCFKKLTSSIRYPEPLWFDCWFNSSCHGLNQWSNITLWRSNFIPSMTQWSIAQYYFWKGRKATFPALSSSPHSTYSWWDLYQMLVVESQQVWCQSEATAILEPHENHEGVVLMESDYSIGIKHSYKGHHYVLQNVLILKAVQVTYMMEHSSPFMRDPASSVNWHKTIVCGGRHILWVVMLSPWFVN